MSEMNKDKKCYRQQKMKIRWLIVKEYQQYMCNWMWRFDVIV